MGEGVSDLRGAGRDLPVPGCDRVHPADHGSWLSSATSLGPARVGFPGSSRWLAIVAPEQTSIDVEPCLCTVDAKRKEHRHFL